MPPRPDLAFHPSAGCMVRLLKDGYWDRIEVIELADGSRRVRLLPLLG